MFQIWQRFIALLLETLLQFFIHTTNVTQNSNNIDATVNKELVGKGSPHNSEIVELHC